MHAPGGQLLCSPELPRPSLIGLAAGDPAVHSNFHMVVVRYGTEPGMAEIPGSGRCQNPTPERLLLLLSDSRDKLFHCCGFLKRISAGKEAQTRGLNYILIAPTLLFHPRPMNTANPTRGGVGEGREERGRGRERGWDEGWVREKFV